MPKVNFSPHKNKYGFVGFAVGTNNVQKEVKITMYKGSKKVLISLGSFFFIQIF